MIALYLSRFIGAMVVLALVACAHVRSTSSAEKSADPSCSDRVRKDDCGFYNCFEDQFNCGAKGYPMGFGNVYCHKFQGLCDGVLTSASAKKWVLGTTQCLQEQLASQYSAIQSCDSLNRTAFNSHPFCYTSGAARIAGVSFCSLSSREWSQVRACVSLGDMLSSSGLTQIASTAARCSLFFAGNLFLEGGESAGEIDAPTQDLMKGMSISEREARSKEFQDFADSIEAELSSRQE